MERESSAERPVTEGGLVAVYATNPPPSVLGSISSGIPAQSSPAGTEDGLIPFHWGVFLSHMGGR